VLADYGFENVKLLEHQFIETGSDDRAQRRKRTLQFPADLTVAPQQKYSGHIAFP